MTTDASYRGERRRIAVRLRDAYNKEDEINAKADALRVSLRLWLQEQARAGVPAWTRPRQPDPNGFFERVQNVHLIPLLMAVYVSLVLVLTIAS